MLYEVITVCCIVLLSVLNGCQSLDPIESWQQNTSSCTLVLDGCAGGVEALSLEDTTGSLAAWTRYQGLTMGMTDDQRVRALVITSYSIHYTKLYDRLLFVEGWPNDCNYLIL